jgi:hypothetical protein
MDDIRLVFYLTWPLWLFLILLLTSLVVADRVL